MSVRQGMRPSTIAGMLVVAGIGIGAMLSAILPDLSFGIGSGWNGLGNKSGSEKSVAEEKSKNPKSQSADKSTVVEPVNDEVTATGPDEVAVEAPPVIYVLINGRDYLLRQGPENKVSQKPARLQEVIQAALQTTGDENGVRVRIFETTTAKTTAQKALLDHLAEAGIPRNEIRLRDEPVVE